MDKNVAKAIINAQICSDAGKGLFEVENSTLLELMRKKGYKGKDTQIFKAIEIINRKKNTGFYYSVITDKRYVALYIVYFNFKLNGKRKQVSFHSFDKRLHKYICPECKTHWDKKDSRQTVIELAKHFGY